jgi:ABC-type branched-subunit amino acid transport system permease subunit
MANYVPLSTESMGSLRMFIIGLLIILFLLYRPEGLIKEKKKVYE